jgi:NADPH2:quinone reductase
VRAAWYDRKGPAREVPVVGGLDRTAPVPGEVLVRVRASAVYPSDPWAATGTELIPALEARQLVETGHGGGRVIIEP